MEAVQSCIHCQLFGLTGLQAIDSLGQHVQNKIGLVILMLQHSFDLTWPQHTLQQQAEVWVKGLFQSLGTAPSAQKKLAHVLPQHQWIRLT